MDATRGPIVFRCDGTPERGWEPLYRCLSLAAALQRRRRGTHFFSYLDPLSLAPERECLQHTAELHWLGARAAADLALGAVGQQDSHAEDRAAA